MLVGYVGGGPLGARCGSGRKGRERRRKRGKRREERSEERGERKGEAEGREERVETERGDSREERGYRVR